MLFWRGKKAKKPGLDLVELGNMDQGPGNRDQGIGVRTAKMFHVEHIHSVEFNAMFTR
jgi:hypothetical protein